MNVSDLKKYKESCYSALSRDLTEFEKNFLLIAGGILAFSTTFIRDVIKLSEVEYLPILFVAWALIIGSIALMMQAFLKSASSSDKLLNAVDSFELKHSLSKEAIELSANQWLEIRSKVSEILFESKNKLKRLRNWAVRFFLLGIILLSVFVSINLIKEQTRSQVNNSTEFKK